MRLFTSRLNLVVCILVIVIGGYFRYVSVSETYVPNILRNDAEEYFSYAYNLRHNHIYSKDAGHMKGVEKKVAPDAMRNPGYPIFLSLFIDGRPSSEIINRILLSQLIISVLSIVLVVLFYQKFLPLKFTLFASSMVAICPHLIVSNSYILTETLFCFMIIAMALMVSMFIKKPEIFKIFISGMLMGLANLIRPSLLYFNLLMVVFLLLHYGKQNGIKYFSVLFLGFLLAFSPFIIRNYKTLGVITDKRLMINFLHHGMYPDFKFQGIKNSYGYPYRFDPNSNEIGRKIETVAEEIKRRFAMQPWIHIKWYIFKKPVAFWSWNNVQGKNIFVYPVKNSPYFTRILFKVTYIFMRSMHWLILLLGTFGMLVVWAPKQKMNTTNHSVIVARFSSLLLIYFTTIHMIGFPLPRYSIPLRPFMYGMAMFGIYFILEVTRKSKSKISNVKNEC